MSKRTTEAVLRDEVAKVEKLRARALARSEGARRARDTAAAYVAETDNDVEVATESLRRAQAALVAFLGVEVDRPEPTP